MSDIYTPEQIRQYLWDEFPQSFGIYLDLAIPHLNKYGFKTLLEFVEAPVNDGGLQLTKEQALWLIDQNPALKSGTNKQLKETLGIADLAKNTEVLGDVKNNKPAVDKSENINSKGGTSSKYRIAKLKRDFPDIAQRLMDGEFKSVSEAERAAGIGKPLMSNVQKALNMISNLTPDEQIELRKLL